jgi:hypothetical protein
VKILEAVNKVQLVPGKEILLKIRVCDRVAGGYEGGDKFSFVALPVIQIQS